MNPRFICTLMLASLTFASLRTEAENASVSSPDNTITFGRLQKMVSVDSIKLDCKDPGTWKFTTSTEEKNGILFYHVTMDAQMPETPPVFTLAMTFPQQDIHHVWNTDYGKHCQLQADWTSPYVSQLASNLPLYTLFNDNDENRLTIVCDEALRYVEAKIGLREEGCNIVCNWTFFRQPEAPLNHYEVTLMLDCREQFWSKSVEEGMTWMRQSAKLEPCHVPSATEDPLYSTWYQFHQSVFDKEIEEECKIASELGMKTIIVDDGWQTDDTNRGYAYCGDWEVSPRRFPDMAAHVRKVHDMGMKYMMWYSVPFVGIKSKNYERFKDKFLFFDKGAQAGVLDPRFPEVREFLCGIYEKAMHNWNIDGFKLDFIDSFHFDSSETSKSSDDPAVADNYAGRDIKALPEAINVLMKQVHDHLCTINPDVLLEFRQSYIGPAICQFGNMLRSSDCPGDLTTNRCHIAYLRLTSGKTAVHADMLEWNKTETPEVAARAILSAIYGVIQYSVMLRDITSEQKAVIKNWLDFSQQHRETLLHGEFMAYHPERDFPVLEAAGRSERIITSYQDDVVAAVSADKAVAYVLNGNGSKQVLVDMQKDAKSVEIYDTYGKCVSKLKTLAAGIQRITVPVSGYIKINF